MTVFLYKLSTLYGIFTPKSFTHCRKACAHFKHLAMVILHWHKLPEVRKGLRKSSKAMTLNHKDIVFVEEILCFQRSNEPLGGGSWKFSNQWGDLQFRGGHTLSQQLTAPGRLRLIRTDVFLWSRLSPLKPVHDSGQPWNIRGHWADPLPPSTFRKAPFTSLFRRL